MEVLSITIIVCACMGNGISLVSKFNLLNATVTGREGGPSPSTLVANAITIMLVKLEHTDLEVSNMWLHCPLVHAEAEIATESHVFPEEESE